MILENIKVQREKGKKMFALLIDPDNAADENRLKDTIDVAEEAGVDLFLVGGSLITNGNLDRCIKSIRQQSSISTLLFPGNILQINENAQGILLLSLISGRNPELLIGKHVIAAPLLKQSGLEVISTGYMLIDGGRITSVTYMSNTLPIPHDKDNIAACTAMAGEMLGMKLIYMDAGSGANHPISPEMISAVRKSIDIPLVVGGGIRSAKDALSACRAGADMIVVGNGAEKELSLVKEIAESVRSL
jgi:phosphoglycerol geranylgeranyltransferase